MTESEEFAQFTQSVVASLPKEEPAPEEKPAPETAPPAEKTTEDKPADTEQPKPADKPAADAPKPEDKKEEPKPEEKKTDWAAEAAKDRERRAQKAAAKLAAQKREQEFAEAKAKAEKLERIMALSKDKRLAALAELGMTLNDVNSEYVRDLEENPNKPPPAVLEAQKELAAIKAELKEWREEKERSRVAQAQQEAQAQATKIKAEYETKAFAAIKEKPDEYEALSKHPQGSEVVFHFIAAHYADTATLDDAGNVIVPGEELDVHEACRRVEAKLLEHIKWTADVKKLRGSAKAPDSATLSGDQRQPEPPRESSADEDSEFKNLTLRLVKQQAG